MRKPIPAQGRDDRVVGRDDIMKKRPSMMGVVAMEKCVTITHSDYARLYIPSNILPSHGCKCGRWC